MRRARLLLTAVALVVTALACGRRAETGTYELWSVNGERLPVRAGSHPSGGAEIVGGSVTLKANGSYQHRMLLQVRYDTLRYADSVVQAGRYEAEGDTILLKTPAGAMRGQVSDGILALEVEGWRYRYRKARAQP
jgi:hypothetical protein